MSSVMLDKLSESDKEAIHMFEKAVEKEGHGLMSDAVEFYRKAFKLNEKVDLLYRHEKVPHNVSQLKAEGGKNVAERVDEEKVKKINVDQLLDSFCACEAFAPDPNNPDQLPEDAMTIKFANLGVDNHEVIADVKSISPLTHLPNDIWLYILEILVLTDAEAWFNFSITCKKFSYLGLGMSNIWRRLCYLVYPKQNYYENKLYIESNQTVESDIKSSLPVPLDQLKIIELYNMSWKHMFHTRPFIKFHGCYISVVNYYSEGARQEFSLSWTNPVRTVTYYRYLRFYPDGTCIKTLTALEPLRVIPQFLKENSAIHPNPESKDLKENHRIFHGTWTISLANEVQICIDNGSVPYYNFHYHFEVKNLGGIFKHNRLKWIRYYGLRKSMSDNDDREGEIAEFSLKKETAFKFLKVKSYS